MDREWYQKIDEWMDAHKEELAADICTLVKIPSISDPENGNKEAPFGAECRKALDEMLAMGRKYGFCTENYENYVGSIGNQTLARSADLGNTIGFWNHLDVVPVGNNWQYEPFEPVIKEHFLIGRGSQDNKGSAVGMLYVMRCLRDLGVPLQHELCLFVGCDEERGMTDLTYYRDHYPCPAMSMIADSGFPVCYGEKGILEGELVFQGKLSDTILICEGGNASNMIPDRARVVLRRTDELEEEITARISGNERLTVTAKEDCLTITAHGTSRHSAFPEGSCNAVHELSLFLKDLSCLRPEDRAQFGALAGFSEEYYGANTGIAFEDEISGRTTCAATVLTLEDGHLRLTLNIRYAITQDSQKLQELLTKTAASSGCSWEMERDSAPNYFPKDHPAVKLLTDLYNELTGEHRESFVMGGGTYARKLPNAFAYGPGGLQENDEDKAAREKIFLPGHGGAHEPDEGLNLRLLVEALKIYARSIIALNECPLEVKPITPLQATGHGA